MQKSFYAVKKGYECGIFESWADTEKQVKGYSGACYKKFSTKIDAIEFLITKSPEATTSKDQILTNKHKSTWQIEEENSTLNKKRKLDNNNPTKITATSTLATTAINFSKSSSTKNVTSPKNYFEASKTSPGLVTSNEPPIRIASPKKSRDSFLAEFETKSIQFKFDKGEARVFTDGACSNNGKETASAGIGVFWGQNHPLNVSKKLNGVQTNNRAEITAAIVAITQSITYGAQELRILTDSDFMIRCMTDWVIKWKKNGWKTSGNAPVKNVDDLKKLDELCSKIKVKWEHVPGHKGHYGNEEADKLARKAVTS